MEVALEGLFQEFYWAFLNPSFRDKYRWASHCHAYSSRQGEPTHVCCKGHHQHLFRALSQDFSPEQAQKFCGLNSFAAVVGPKYDGKYLRSLTDGLLGNLTLKQTLTDVIIPTFDIKLLQPVIFSTYDAKLNDLKNARLADICISTSAAPTFLPARYFEAKDASGNTKSFNLIDGGVAATCK
ncbi:hypothetical protein CMV_003124 [Castanea mollissima]|uniref:Patatin n=1 Tax=Castanea mollissima TaxID=60419 RepID=A0A8J4VVH3_9ROSI|nr:hypothetical protein CMV_003124 [Castanea mollissima]